MSSVRDVAVAPWCIGGTRVDVQILLSLPILTALAISVASMPERRSPILWPLLVLLAAAVPTCLQLIHCSFSVLELMSPKSAELYRNANPDSTMAPISVDVLATARAAIHQIVFASVALLVALGGRAYNKTFAWVIVANGVLMTMVAMTHSLIGLDRVLGFYESLHREQVTGFVGPFINPNTLASYLVLSTFTALGLAVSEEDSGRLRFALIAGLVCLAGVVLTESRGRLIGPGLWRIFSHGLGICFTH